MFKINRAALALFAIAAAVGSTTAADTDSVAKKTDKNLRPLRKLQDKTFNQEKPKTVRPVKETQNNCVSILQELVGQPTIKGPTKGIIDKETGGIGNVKFTLAQIVKLCVQHEQLGSGVCPKEDIELSDGTTLTCACVESCNGGDATSTCSAYTPKIEPDDGGGNNCKDVTVVTDNCCCQVMDSDVCVEF